MRNVSTVPHKDAHWAIARVYRQWRRHAERVSAQNLRMVMERIDAVQGVQLQPVGEDADDSDESVGDDEEVLLE